MSSQFTWPFEASCALLLRRTSITKKINNIDQ